MYDLNGMWVKQISLGKSTSEPFLSSLLCMDNRPGLAFTRPRNVFKPM